ERLECAAPRFLDPSEVCGDFFSRHGRECTAWTSYALSMRSCDTGRLDPARSSGQRDEPVAVDRDESRALSRGQPWLKPARSYVHGWPGGHHIWRIGIAAVGLAVVITGIVLLIVPGPGWLVIFLGFAIWATEFPWANAVAKFVRRQITRCTSWIKR